MIISVLNQKGGTGKSVLAVNLARCIQLEYGDTVLLDCDPQATLRAWAREAHPKMPDVYGVPDVYTLLRLVRRFSEIAILDGAGALTELNKTAVAVSDLVLIPCRAAITDVWASADLVELIKEQRARSGGPKAAFVVTQVKAGTRLASQIDGLLRGFGFPVLNARTHDRVVYAEAMTGSTVLDLEPNGAAAWEIRSLTTEILALL